MGEINHIVAAKSKSTVQSSILVDLRSAADDDGVDLRSSAVGAEVAVGGAGGYGLDDLGLSGQQVASEFCDAAGGESSGVEASIEAAAHAGSAGLVESCVVGNVGVVLVAVRVGGEGGPGEDGGVQESGDSQGNGCSHLLGFDGISICYLNLLYKGPQSLVY